MKIQKYNFRFKGIQCCVWIKASYGEEYEILIRTEQEMLENDRKALILYLKEEGYFYQSDITFE